VRYPGGDFPAGDVKQCERFCRPFIVPSLILLGWLSPPVFREKTPSDPECRKHSGLI